MPEQSSGVQSFGDFMAAQAPARTAAPAPVQSFGDFMATQAQPAQPAQKFIQGEDPFAKLDAARPSITTYGDAESRFTRTPIEFGEAPTAADVSGFTHYDNSGKPQVLQINTNTNDVNNARVIRHENVHAMLGGVDLPSLAKDPQLRRLAEPIKKQLKDAGVKVPLDVELPAFLGAFSNDDTELTSGIDRKDRDAYVQAFTKALGKADPKKAVQYQRMLGDYSGGKIDFQNAPDGVQQAADQANQLIHPDAAVAMATENARAMVGLVMAPPPSTPAQMATYAPPVPPPPIAYPLQNDAQQLAGAPTFQNPRTGAIYPRQAPGKEGGPLSILDAPVTGSQQMAEGVARMAQPGLRTKAGGLHKVIGGAFEAATPLMAVSGAAAPVRTGITLATGMVSQEGVEKGLKKLGLPEEWAALAGDLAGVLAGIGTHKAISPEALAAVKAKYEPVLRARFKKAGSPAPAEPQYTTTGQRIGGEPAQPAAQPRAARAAPAAPRMTDAALAELLKTESGPKRLELILQAKQRGLAIPDVAPRAEQAGEALSRHAHYEYLFDEADRRMEAAAKQKAKLQAKGARQKPVVPVEGPSERVARVVYARQNLAEQFGKPWAELSNSERLTIDSLISEGYGHAMPAPGEAAAARTDIPEGFEIEKPSPPKGEPSKPSKPVPAVKLTAAEPKKEPPIETKVTPAAPEPERAAAEPAREPERGGGEPAPAAAPARETQVAEPAVEDAATVLQKLKDARTRIADLSGEELMGLLHLGTDTAKASKTAERNKLLDEVIRLNRDYQKAHPKQSQNAKPAAVAPAGETKVAEPPAPVRARAPLVRKLLEQAKRLQAEAADATGAARTKLLASAAKSLAEAERMNKFDDADAALAKAKAAPAPPKSEAPAVARAKRIRDLRKGGMTYEAAVAQADAEAAQRVAAPGMTANLEAVPEPAVATSEKFLDALHADPESYFAEYERRFGNVLNADNAATLFDDYNADPVANRTSVHAAATEIRDTLFQRRVAAPAPSGKQGVVLTAGGNASGKSTIAALTDARNRASMVLDSTLANADHARRLVDLALDHGKPVLILHAERPLDQAFRGMLERSAEEGRVVSIRQMINSQRGAANTVRELQQEYADDPRVQFRFYDNSGTEPHETTRLPEPQSYPESSGELHNILDSEFRAGRISEAAYRKIRGPEGNRSAPPVRGRGGSEGGGGTEETPPREIPGAVPGQSSGARPEVESEAAGERPAESAAEPVTPATPGPELQPGGEGEAVPRARQPAHEVARGKTTEVYAEGREQPYRARYVVRELSDTYPSHNAITFEPNPDFHFINDRDYKLPANKNRVLNNSGGRFTPVRVINNNPDAINGPSVIDADGNVLGGNNRRMSLERVYSLNPKGAAAYRALLEREAPQFGIDPAAIARMKQPGLFRELIDPVDPQRAITEFNQDPAAELSMGEQAAADARGLSPEIGKYLAAMMDSFGPEATLTDILNSARGADIVNHLIKSNLFTETERPLLLDAKTGAVTSEAKQRIAKMLLGGLFKDSRDFQDSPPSLRNKLERVAPILKALEGRGEWNLTPDVKQALEMMSFERDYGRAFGIKPGESFLVKNVKSEAQGQREYQGGIFDEPGEQPKIPEISARARRIGVFISQNSPRAITGAFRDFAEKSNEKSLFGEPNPDEAFAAAFGDPRLSPEAGMTSREFLNFLTFGLPKFLEQDVAPTLRDAARGLAQIGADAMKFVAPTLWDRSGQRAGLILRGKIGEFARKLAQAQHSTREAEKYFNAQPAEENYDFIDRMEHGKPQATPELDTIAATFRKLLDDGRNQVQALGTGKLQRFYEHYFPHLWKKTGAAQTVFESFFARRPFEGKKAFLKKRTMPTFRDGLDAGLEPASDNPVTLTLNKLEEMGKYVAAHETLNKWKSRDERLALYVDAREGKPPAGWRKIDDPIGTVYGQSIQQISEYPNAGIWAGLQKAANALGLKQERGFMNLHGAVGRASMGGGVVKTLHGTAEDVLAHEIGHQIDWRSGSGKRFVLEYPDAQTVARLKAAYKTLKDKGSAPGDRTAARKELKDLKGAIADRKEFAKQLRDLADLRGGNKDYTHKREEKMAQLAEMWVGSRELFQRTAPKVFAEWKKFLNENPKLHALRDIEGDTEVTQLAQPYDVGGLVIKGHYYAPDGAARILNHYLGPGLSRFGLFRAGMQLNGAMNLFNLGLSGFHVTKTGFEATISRGATGIEQIGRGRVVAGAKNIASAPAAPFLNFVRGIRALREYYEPGTQGAELGNLVDRLSTGGARGRMDAMHRTQIAESMSRAFAQGNVIGAGLRLPFAAMEVPTRLIMDKIVPAVKWGTMLDMMRADLERLGPEADEKDIERVAKETVDAVDDRMGEVARDNFFTNRYLKDLSMFLMRADQYTLGTARAIGGAAIDVVRQPVNALRGEPVNLKRLAYVGSMLAFHMAYSALYQRMHTGKWPEEGEDYFYPKNGEMDERGNPQRTAIWSYLKDVHSFWRHPKQTVQNKIAPAIELLTALYRNKDFWGVEIHHPDDTLAQQLAQTGKFVVKQFEPRSVEQFGRERTLGATPGTQAEQFFGLSPAPSDLDLGPAERMARSIVGARTPGEARTAESAERHDLKQKLTRSLRNNKGIPKEVIEARRSGKLTTRDIAEAVRAAKETPLQAAFVRLSVPEALRVYRSADRAEKRQIQAMLVRKAQAAIASEPPAARAKTRMDLRNALAGR